MQRRGGWSPHDGRRSRPRGVQLLMPLLVAHTLLDVFALVGYQLFGKALGLA